ncbi:MAG: sulfite exporter TauE/SafE family protein, partial [Dehalococcoidia bacterium]
RATMPDVNIWALAATGLVAGTLGSMLGVGGGIMMVPILTLWMGVPMQYAIGSSLVSIVINACTATSVYIDNHVTNLKLGLLLSTTLIPGAVAGAFLASKLSSPVLSLLFGLLMVYVCYTLIPRKPRRLSPEQIEAAKDPHEKVHTTHAWLDGNYYDPAVKQEISYETHRPVTGMATGFFGGVISSLLGVGGGIINVPVMNLLMKVPIKAAIATSSLLLAFTTMTGSLIYAYNGYVMPYIIAPLIPGIFLGAQLGPRIARRVQSKALIVIFIVFLLVTSVLMILRALNIF